MFEDDTNGMYGLIPKLDYRRRIASKVKRKGLAISIG